MVESISTAAINQPMNFAQLAVQSVAEILQFAAGELEKRLAEVILYRQTLAMAPGLVEVVHNDRRYQQAILKYVSSDIRTPEKELAAREEFTTQLLALLVEWQTHANHDRLNKIQSVWEKDKWFAKLDKHETIKILGREQHRLLILTPPPEISLDCPPSFQHNLHTEIRNGTGSFFSRYYPLVQKNHNPSLYPVEFYGDYFKTPISDSDVMRLQAVLGIIPTNIVYSDITDYQVNFHVGFWGLQNHHVAHFSMQPWNWEEAFFALQQVEQCETKALRIIRQIIVTVHQLLAAFVTDWYYLHINPVHKPQLFNLASEFPQAWVQPYIEILQGIYRLNQSGIFYEQGLKLAELGHQHQAIDSFTHALSLQPNFPDVAIAQGIALYNCKSYEKAAACLAEGLKLQPESDEGWYYQGVALSSLGNHQKALHCFQKVTTLKPNQPEGWFELGEVLFQLKHYGDAIKAYSKAIALKPDFQIALENREQASKKYWWHCKDVGTLRGHSAPVTFLSFSSDSQYLASGSSSGHDILKLWSMKTGNEVQILTPHFSWVHALTYSHQSKLLAFSGENNIVEIWSTETGEKLHSMSGHTDWVHAVTFSPDSELLVSGSADKTIKIWSVATGKKIRTFTGHTNWVSCVTFSPDSELLASGSADKTIKIWSAATWKKHRNMTGHSDWMRSVHDPHYVSESVVTYRELHNLSGHNDLISSLAFSPNNKLLASASWDSTVKIWNPATGKEIRTLSGHSDRVYAVAFSADSQYLASASADKTIMIWSVASGKNLRTLTAHGDQVMSLAFCPNSRFLATGSHDKSIIIWRCR
jgi:WD40 repeat protein